MCGKDLAYKFEFVECSGSPPRVREGLAGFFESVADFRITPACAGRTFDMDRETEEL